MISAKLILISIVISICCVIYSHAFSTPRFSPGRRRYSGLTRGRMMKLKSHRGRPNFRYNHSYWGPQSLRSFKLAMGNSEKKNYETSQLNLEPDRNAYSNFFKACLKNQTEGESVGEIDLFTFCKHDDIRLLLDEDLIYIDELQKLWDVRSALKIKSEKPAESLLIQSTASLGRQVSVGGGPIATLGENDSYEILCQIISLAVGKDILEMADQSTDDENSSIADMRYLSQEFRSLANGKAYISYNDFIAWEEIQSLLHDQYCDLDQISEIWTNITGGVKSPCDINMFFTINEQLDAIVGDGEGDIEMIKVDMSDDSGSTSISGNDDEEIDYWNPKYDPSLAFDKDFLSYITGYFNNYCNEQKLLSFEIFSSWEDVVVMMKAGQVDLSSLADLWHEAVIGSQSYYPEGVILESNGTPDRLQSLSRKINLDTFLRLNIRLEVVMNQIEEALANLSDEDVENYYRKEFQDLAKGETLLSYPDLMGWADLKEIVANGDVTTMQVDQIWSALPKQPLGTFHKAKESLSSKSGKGFGKALPVQADGITEATFLAFNQAIEDLNSENIADLQ